MANNSKKTKSNVEVLYQKMGNRWFAFSLVGDEVYVGSITPAEIDQLENGEMPSEMLANGDSDAGNPEVAA